MTEQMRIGEFLEELSSEKPVPGGGGACAALGAMGAALGMMAANLTAGKKRYAKDEEEIRGALEGLRALKDKLFLFIGGDAEAFMPLAEAYKLPRGTKEEREEKGRALEKALSGASLLPLELMETAYEAMELLEVLEKKGSRMAVSDVGAGILFLQSAIEGAALNVFINTKLMKDEGLAESLRERANDLIGRGEALKRRVYKNVLCACMPGGER